MHPNAVNTSTEAVKTRQERLLAAYNSRDVDELFAFFSKKILYSDYGVNNLNQDYEAVKAFFTEVYAKTTDLSFELRSISGTETFTAWEYDLTFKYVETSDILGGLPAEGQTIKLREAGLYWWAQEEVVAGGDPHGEGAIKEKVWKVIRCHNYGKMVEE
ncbi:MAG: hypothetical protein LQ347_004517 [Umbilicaria vellea]|nr:MAG: hypothetical protein LQ347_004517 [Umbilicaria vellea]